MEDLWVGVWIEEAVVSTLCMFWVGVEYGGWVWVRKFGMVGLLDSLWKYEEDILEDVNRANMFLLRIVILDTMRL